MESRMGIDPDQLAFWMEVLDAGIIAGVVLALSPLILAFVFDCWAGNYSM